jgi:hypothetical protein
MSKTVKTLLFDLETAPNLGYTWAKWEQNVIQFEQEWYLLSFAWKWLGDEEVQVLGLDDFPKAFKADPTNDYHLVEKLHALFDEADIVIGHNSNSFDNKKAQGRMLVHGLDPPSPYQEVDTLRVAKRYFSFNSYKLGDLGEALGVGTKAETGGFETWLKVMAGDKKAWKVFKEYNQQDVVLLEEIYLRMRPWIEGHPNVALLAEGDMELCPRCGEDAMIRQGFKHTRTMTYQRWSCTACGGWSRSRISEKDEPKPAFVN